MRRKPFIGECPSRGRNFEASRGGLRRGQTAETALLVLLCPDY